MLLTLFYPFIKFALGTLYPAYKTWKSLGRKDDTIRVSLSSRLMRGNMLLMMKEMTKSNGYCVLPKPHLQRRWMKYWVSFSVFQTIEYFADLTVAFVMPFYIEFKISALMWLVHMRASSLIDSAVDKELKKREKTIDKWLKKINNEFIGVVWFELSRCSIKILAILLKSVAATHHINLSDNSPMELDHECDRSNEFNDQTNSNNNNDLTMNNETTNDNNNQLEYNIIEESNDTASMSTRKLRVKREQLVNSVRID